MKDLKAVKAGLKKKSVLPPDGVQLVGDEERRKKTTKETLSEGNKSRIEVEQLQELCASLRESLSAYAQSEEALRLQLGAAKSESASAAAALDEAQDRCKALENTNARLEEEKADKVAEMEDMEEKVEQLAGSLEARLKKLSDQLEERDGELLAMTENKDNQAAGLDEVKTLLKDSVSERARLADDLAAHERQVVKLRADMKETEARAESSRRRAAESSAQLAEMRARLESEEESGLSVAQRGALEDEVADLRGTLATTQEEAGRLKTALQEAQKGRAAEEAKRVRATQELAQARGAVVEAEARAEAERGEREGAQQEAQRMREDQERRAKVFNEAVKKAVSKIQGGWEAERESLARTVSELEVERRELQAEREGWAHEAEALGVQGTELRAEVESLLGEMQVAKEGREQAEEKAHARAQALAQAERAREEAVTQLRRVLAESLQREESATATILQLDDEKTQAQSLASSASARVAQLEAEVQSKQAEAEEVALREANKKEEKCTEETLVTRAESHGAQQRMLDLEKMIMAKDEELAEKETQLERLQRNQKSSSQVGLEGLGLEQLNLKSYQDKVRATSDIESNTTTSFSLARSNSAGMLAPKRLTALNKQRGKTQDKNIGKISTRSAMMLLYLVALHLCVMWSFTRQSPAVQCNELQLP